MSGEIVLLRPARQPLTDRAWRAVLARIHAASLTDWQRFLRRRLPASEHEGVIHDALIRMQQIPPNKRPTTDAAIERAFHRHIDSISTQIRRRQRHTATPIPVPALMLEVNPSATPTPEEIVSFRQRLCRLSTQAEEAGLSDAGAVLRALIWEQTTKELGEALGVSQSTAQRRKRTLLEWATPQPHRIRRGDPMRRKILVFPSASLPASPIEPAPTYQGAEEEAANLSLRMCRVVQVRPDLIEIFREMVSCAERCQRGGY